MTKKDGQDAAAKYNANYKEVSALKNDRFMLELVDEMVWTLWKEEKKNDTMTD